MSYSRKVQAEIKSAKVALLSGALLRAERRWPKQCMAITAAKKRCANKGYVHELENGRIVKLCKLHDHLREAPEDIKNWSIHSPNFNLVEKSIKEKIFCE